VVGLLSYLVIFLYLYIILTDMNERINILNHKGLLMETVTVEEKVVKVDKPTVPTLKMEKKDDTYHIDRSVFMEHCPLAQDDVKTYEEYSKEYIVKATELLCSKVEDGDDDVTGRVEVGIQDEFTITVTKAENEPMIITELNLKHMDITDTLIKQEALLLAKLKDD